ncbi:unnamed protein product [Aureobasidium pullulans]|nr:unnamed protein product [Aureobasidium pullulans]
MSNYRNQDFGDAASDEEEDDFNPVTHASDDEGADNDDNDQRQDNNQADDDDHVQTTNRRQSAQSDDQDEDAAPVSRRANNDDDDEEDEDDEEEEEDEDEDDEDIGQPRKRRRKGPRNQFLDVEAEVDDEDEEEPDEDDEVAGEEMHPDDLLELPAGAERDDRKHRELDRQRDLAASMDAEKQAQALKERYGRNRAANVDSAVVPQRLLLPSVEDPHIWRLKCKPGKEREVVFAIMKRIEDRAGTREPLQLISAFERGGVMAGNLYCEARIVDDVTTALEGLQNVYMGTKPMMVPITEMPDLLRTRKSKSLEPGMYVRVKRGKYAGDLAQIDEVESNGTEVTLRLIPRLDYGLNDDNEARKRHGRYLTKGTGFTANTWTYMNDTYVDGFLIKDYKANHLQSEDVNPTLEEVTKFAADAEDGTENLDLSALAATIKSNSSGAFLPGDHVEIWQGEQRGVVGKAVSVHSDIVRILVSTGELAGQIIESPVKGLRKLFREGDHVKVIGGSKYFDEVGMVVKIVEDRVTILTDSNQTEITVFSKDLRVATDSGGQVGVGKYDLHELVQLDAATVACVIKVDRESLRVLDQTGTVRSLLPSNISNKLERRKLAVATDREGSEIHIDDTGRVLHIHRNFLFAHNREQTDNAGVFVVRTNNAGLMKMNPALQRPGAQQAGAQGMPPPRQMGRDRLIGKTITIRKGPHKGLLGIVKDSTDTHARVEVHGSKKIISIAKEFLTVRDPITGAVIQQNAGQRPGAPPAGGAGGRPPAWGGATPGRFGATPRPSDGGRTPAWKPAAGGRTPAWAGAGAGGRTAYGGASGVSSGTWNPNTRTPFHAGGTAYDSGSKTPAYGGMDAPTPGYNSAPTPGNLDQPTPGYAWNADTPAGDGPGYD